MTVPAASNNYSLQASAEDTKRTGICIGRLFATLHSQDNGVTTKAVMENYLEVLEGLPSSAIEQASELYRKGVKGNGRFVPMAAEFAQTVRELIEAENERERSQAKRQREVESLKAEIAERERLKAYRAGITPESKARVEAMRKKSADYIATVKLANELHLPEQLPSSLPDMKETHERFKSQGREALLKSLEA